VADPPAPTVTLKIRVPAKVPLGQEIEYRIYAENTSAAPAHHVAVRSPLPGNTRYVKSTPEPTHRDPELQWQLDTLEAGAKREIVLVLSAVDSTEVNVCARVQFEHGQCVRTTIARPTLTIHKEGPTQAKLNESVNFKLTVTNTSNVEAGNVLVTDVLPAGLEHSSGKNRLNWIIGKVAPRESKSVEYQVIAKATGRLCNKAIATADGGIREEAGSCVTVIEAKLRLKVLGPARRYLNLPARYEITVTNDGSAELNEVQVTGSLPAQVSFLSASDAGRSGDNQVKWTVASLPPAASRTVELILSAQSPGRLCTNVVATAEYGLSERAEACTEFAGVPALSLNVEDSDDPVEVGGVTTYTITVRNPGSTAATNVRVTAQIPVQMELTRAAGMSDHRRDGPKVAFNPITLEAGSEGRFQIEVKAARPGDVRFKVELTADQLTGGPVQQEESTTIYAASPTSRTKNPKAQSTAKPGQE
jgi:uncharacterized repeat protein (TIGR01451 family)